MRKSVNFFEQKMQRPAKYWILTLKITKKYDMPIYNK